MDRRSSERRKFITGSLRAGAGLLMATAALPHVSFAMQEKPVRMGFVGVGGRGTGMLRVALTQGIQITAVCDIIEERVARAQRIVEEVGQPKPKGYSCRLKCENQTLLTFRRIAYTTLLLTTETPRHIYARLVVSTSFP